MSMQVYEHRKSVWSVAAERHLRQALDDLASGLDPIPETDAALACLRISVGELPPDMGLLEPEDRETASGSNSAALLSKRNREDWALNMGEFRELTADVPDDWPVIYVLRVGGGWSALPADASVNLAEHQVEVVHE
jgi:hypothetical protein